MAPVFVTSVTLKANLYWFKKKISGILYLSYYLPFVIALLGLNDILASELSSRLIFKVLVHKLLTVPVFVTSVTVLCFNF